MRAQTLRDLNRERAARRAAVVVRDLETGEARLVREGEIAADPLAAAIASAVRSGRSGPADAEHPTQFLNVYVPSPRLVVIGAVHISQALAPMAAGVGLDVRVVDPRGAFATPERFPVGTLLAEWPDQALARDPLDPWTALAAVTHDPKIDDGPLGEALRAGCFYVGALGSRKTHARRLERLAATGLAPDALARIEAPIGLDIGAASPPEIAVAILGSVIRALRRRAAEQGASAS